jgi:hypothetical protein
MSVKLRTLDVEIVGCGSNVPIREFQIPDTGDASVNLRIAELVHETLLGVPYECTRCSGGDYHFHRSVHFVGPVTHRVAPAAAVTAQLDNTGTTAAVEELGSKVVKGTCCGFEIPVDKNGIPFVASYDCC